MRQIRTAARQERAKLTGLTRGTVGKVASYQRSAITYGKEKALSSYEDQKTEIENELMEVDRKINRLTNIQIDDVEIIVERIRRCSYCGCRVEFGDICPGCGSDKTTYALE
jgi:hypothetical protein